MAGPAVPSAHIIRVWDPLVRLLHWTLVGTCLANLTILRDGDELHNWLGYIALGAVAVRVAWGFVGPRHARFRDFVTSPRTVLRYVNAMRTGSEARYIGHNPAGAVMILFLLLAVATLGVTGWMMGTDMFWGEEWVQQLHEITANVLVGAVFLHAAGAILEGLRHEENLVASMITGKKRGPSESDMTNASAADRR